MRFLFLFLLMHSSMSVADSGLDTLKQFHNNIKTLKAEFTQVLHDVDANEVQESRGIVWIQRPGLFRWEYSNPYPQVIVADGSKIWIYDPELEQVTIKKESDAIGSAPGLVLSGKRALEEDFNMKEIDRKDAYTWVSLTPKKEDADFSEIAVAFIDKTIAILELKDKLGQRTKIHFKGLETNISLDASRFEFRTPPGTDVIGGEQL